LLGLEAKPQGRKGNESIPESIFELFPVLETMRSLMGGDLSGGQQQQLEIVRALIGKLRLSVLDEPMEGVVVPQ